MEFGLERTASACSVDCMRNMRTSEPQYLPTENGESLAYSSAPGSLPGLFWLPGFNSDMAGNKAKHLADWAKREAIGFTALDYSGHGRSSGRLSDGTITRWLADALAVFDRIAAGPQILIGSSMGGWIALLLALARPARVAGLVLIAPSPDFTEDLIWEDAGPEIRGQIIEQGAFNRPSGDPAEQNPITRTLIEDGRRHLLLRQEIAICAPVRIFHGMADMEVPYERSLLLAQRLVSRDVIVEIIKAGDHRLSTPDDLARFEVAIRALANCVAKT